MRVIAAGIACQDSDVTAEGDGVLSGWVIVRESIQPRILERMRLMLPYRKGSTVDRHRATPRSRLSKAGIRTIAPFTVGRGGGGAGPVMIRRGRIA